MRIINLFLIILFFCIYSILVAQDIKEYGDLHPTINNIDSTIAEERNIFFYSSGGYQKGYETILKYSLPDGNEEIIENNTLIDISEIGNAFWNPNTKKNFCFFTSQNQREPQYSKGWHELFYDGKILSVDKDSFLHIFPGFRSQLSYEIPNSEYKFVSNYSINGDKKKQESFRVLNIFSNDVIFDYSTIQEINRNFHNGYWISGNWLLMENLSIIANEELYTDTIVNFSSHEERSFSPDIILGYGCGFLLTTSKDLRGITIQDPDKNIVFQDEDFDLITPMRDKDFGYIGLISFAYIDFPFIYISVYNGFGANRPYYSIIANTSTCKTYSTIGSRYDTILGVF